MPTTEAIHDSPLETLKADLSAFRPHLLSFLTGKCNGNVDMAEELTQQTLLRALMSLHTFREGDDIRPWLYTIARNVCVDMQRSSFKRRMNQFDIISSEGDTRSADEALADHRTTACDINLETRETAAQMWRLLHNNSSKKSNYLYQYYKGNSMERIAEEHRVPKATVKSRIAAALRFLRQKFA